jgi:hypothetical protein
VTVCAKSERSMCGFDDRKRLADLLAKRAWSAMLGGSQLVLLTIVFLT